MKSFNVYFSVGKTTVRFGNRTKNGFFVIFFFKRSKNGSGSISSISVFFPLKTFSLFKIYQLFSNFEINGALLKVSDCSSFKLQS